MNNSIMPSNQFLPYINVENEPSLSFTVREIKGTSEKQAIEKATKQLDKFLDDYVVTSVTGGIEASSQNKNAIWTVTVARVRKVNNSIPPYTTIRYNDEVQPSKKIDKQTKLPPEMEEIKDAFINQGAIKKEDIEK